MIEIVRSTGQTNPPKVDYTSRALESGAAANRAAAPPSANYVRALGSAAQNARTPGSIKAGSWQVRSQSPLSSPAMAVLTAGNRVVVQRTNGWTLFDRDGRQVAEGTQGRAPVTLDPSPGMFYALGPGNMLDAIALENGERRFRIPLGYNENFAWPFVHRSGKRLVVAAAEQSTLSPTPRKPMRSLFQAIEVGSPVRLSPYQVLLSIDLQQDLLFNDANMMAVAAGDVLWAIFPNLLIRTSPAQNVDGAYSDAFTPIAASADEAGWLHLVVATGTGADARRDLWIVTPEGRRTVRVAIPAAYRESKFPPAIGYDRRVYLRTSRSLIALSPGGERLWEATTTGDIAGVGLTPDGRVIVAAGQEVLALDANGKPTQLASLPAAATTAPVVTTEGEILIGTANALLTLVAR